MARRSGRRSSAAQALLDAGADHCGIGASLDPGAQVAHHLAHVTHAGGASVGDRLIDEGIELRRAQWLGQELADDVDFRLLASRQLVTTGLLVVTDRLAPLL